MLNDTTLNNLDKKQLSAAHRRALSDTMLVSTMNLVFPNQRDFIIKPFFFTDDRPECGSVKVFEPPTKNVKNLKKRCPTVKPLS